MEGFKQIPGGRAIIRQKGGLLKEVNLFSRAGRCSFRCGAVTSASAQSWAIAGLLRNRTLA